MALAVVPDTASEALNAVIYARVSKDQRAGRSVNEQLQECRALCSRHGWNVVREFVDNDKSASRYAKTKRPEFADMLGFLPSGEAQVLVSWEGSRNSRDLAE